MDTRRGYWLTTMAWGLILSAAILAQDAHRHSSPDDVASPADAHRRVDAILQEADVVVASGRGFGMAFAADQNGYPGPMHATELRDQLSLTIEQVSALDALTQSMFAASRPRSRDLIDAEARLRQVFASGAATEADVESMVRDIERTRADVRLIHLMAHVRTFEILTVHQRQLYGQIRWGGR